MIVILDVGNSQIHGGLFAGDRFRAEFRKSTTPRATADEIGLFLVQFLREHGVAPVDLVAVGIATVVPALTDALMEGSRRYLDRKPFFLAPGARTGLKIKTRSPEEVGADRIASAIGALEAYPGEHLIVVDLGTATTFDCVSADREFLGGVIAPGLRVSMESLTQNTAKLPPVEIVKVREALGRSTVTTIQSGLYFGHVGLARELLPRLKREAFGENAACRIIGTGGYAGLFAGETPPLFDHFESHLVLRGILHATRLNADGSHRTHPKL